MKEMILGTLNKKPELPNKENSKPSNKRTGKQKDRKTNTCKHKAIRSANGKIAKQTKKTDKPVALAY